MPRQITTKFILRHLAVILLGIGYLLLGGLSAAKTIKHADVALRLFDQILATDNMQNNGAIFLEQFDKHHPLLGAAASPTVRKAFNFPSYPMAREKLEVSIPHLYQQSKKEAALAAGSSLLLVVCSSFYVALLVVLFRTLYSRFVVIGLIFVTMVIFVVGISAPAMVIWTIPNIPVETGSIEFVLQHQVRSITSVITGLFNSGHWVLGFLIMLFSIVTPLIKAFLTLLAVLTKSTASKSKITNLLHAIGKWSMADVFVAGVLLSLFSLQSQDATKTISCLGLYYFVGYCLLSLVTTSILDHSPLGDDSDPLYSARQMPSNVVAGVFSLIFLILVIGGYTLYKTPSSGLPTKLSPQTQL